jgi:hypothetical protein
MRLKILFFITHAGELINRRMTEKSFYKKLITAAAVASNLPKAECKSICVYGFPRLHDKRGARRLP